MTPEQHKQKLARIKYLMGQKELDEDQDEELEDLWEQVAEYRDKLHWAKLISTNS